MSNEDHPIAILEAIVDEVQGLRRTDARSFLPESLLRRARAATDPGAQPDGTSYTDQKLRSLDDLEGRTVRTVFESGLKCASVVILCTDGAFLALEGQDDDEVGVHWWPKGTKLADYVLPRELHSAGLMSAAEWQGIQLAEKQAKERSARVRVEAAERELAQAKAALEKSNG